MHESFLQSIIETPDDDGPRLVYADWLDEHGESDRAEFIRVQCEWARLPAGDRRRNKLASRASALLKAHPDWRMPGTGVVGEMHRGFLEAVTLSPRLFVTHAVGLFARFPIRSVTFRELEGPIDLIRQVADSPLLARLAALRFQRWPAGSAALGPTGLRGLLESSHLGNLRSLNLSRNDLETPGAIAIAGARQLQSLTALDLGGNRIDVSGVQALAGAAHLAGLTSLVLMQNHLGPTGATAIAESPHLTRLTHLDLTRTRIQSTGVHALAASANLSDLQILCLGRLRLGVLSAKALVRSPHLARLRVLELRSNRMDDDSAEVFASSTAFPDLTLLDLRRNTIGSKAAAALRARFGKRVKL